jgi:hypothetical protein
VTVLREDGGKPGVRTTDKCAMVARLQALMVEVIHV